MQSSVRFSLIATCLLSAVPCVAAATVASQEAAKLVATMRLDFTVLDAIQWRAKLKASTGINAAYECLLKQDYSRFNPALAERVADRLSGEEIRFALNFYSSPVGQKFTDAALVDVHRGADASVGEDYPEFTPDERARLSEFTQSDLYKKLQRLLAPVPRGTLEVQREMFAECSSAAGQ